MTDITTITVVTRH